MKKILATIILASFLSGCRSTGEPPREYSGEQCQPVFSYVDGEISVEDSFCRCRQYVLSKDYIGSVGSSYRKELSYCDQYLGYSVKSNNRLVDFYIYVQSKINEQDESFVQEQQAEE